MNRKTFLTGLSISIVVLTVIFAPLSLGYDPWVDYDEDGTIDVSDLSTLGQEYGTSGDQTKNVSVTNWPEPSAPLFPDYVTLRATGQRHANTMATGAVVSLIDENTPYLPNTFEIHTSFHSLSSGGGWTLLFNDTWIYQKMPTTEYRILGIPKVTLTANVTFTDVFAELDLSMNATFGKVLPDGTWTSLRKMKAYMGSTGNGPVQDRQFATSCAFGFTPLDQIIGPYERLAIRIELYGKPGVLTDITNLTLELLFHENTDEFRLDVPMLIYP